MYLSVSEVTVSCHKSVQFRDLSSGESQRVFENTVLRKIFGRKREEDGSWKKLRNDELHNRYSSRNIVRAIKSRRMRWARHVARMGERCSQGFDLEARR
jgi:hypothetical protein